MLEIHSRPENLLVPTLFFLVKTFFTSYRFSTVLDDVEIFDLLLTKHFRKDKDVPRSQESMM
ncbi:MAG: hypothetical protein ACTSUE_17600 [Promethearchaeota archaeon]